MGYMTVIYLRSTEMYMPRILVEEQVRAPAMNIGSSFGCSNAKEINISLHFVSLSFMSFFIHHVLITLTRVASSPFRFY